MKNLDLEMARGDTGRYNMTFSINLTGAKIWFTAKRAITDADEGAIIALSTTAGGITITNGPAGVASLVIPPSATSALVVPAPPQSLTLFYDIQVKEADATVTTVQGGKLHIKGDVTHSTA